MVKKWLLQDSGGGEFRNLAPCVNTVPSGCAVGCSACSGTLLQQRAPLKRFWRSWQNLSASAVCTPSPSCAWGLLVNPGLAALAATCSAVAFRTLSARQPNLSPSPNLPTKASSFLFTSSSFPYSLFFFIFHLLSSIQPLFLLLVYPPLQTWLFQFP